MNRIKKAMILSVCILMASSACDTTGVLTENAYAAGGIPVRKYQVQSSGVFRSDLANLVVVDVNNERAKYGLKPLRVDSELSRAASVRAEEIVRKFSHTRPDGTKWSTVSRAAYGENIAKGQKTAHKVMAAWLTSKGHRANILKASYGSIGVASYVYNGVTYWVQLFGK